MSKGRKKRLHNGDADSQFEAFMKASFSSEDSTLDTGRVNKFIETPRSRKKKDALWMIEDDEDESEEIGLLGTGNKFLKKSNPKPAARTKTPPTLNRDSLDDESLRSINTGVKNPGDRSGVPMLNLGGSSNSFSETTTGGNEKRVSREPVSLKAGKETLDELADKERFFKEMEREHSSTVDFSRLNKELDREETMGFGGGGTLENISESHDESGLYHHMHANGHCGIGSGGSISESHDGMLAKVALMDSLDSTMGSNSRPRNSRDPDMDPIHEGDIHDNGYDEPDATVFGHLDDGRKTDTEPTQGVTLKTGTGFGYTNTSHDFEALQHILKKQVGMGTIEGEDYTLKDSSTAGGMKSSMFATQKTQDGVSGDSNTPAFGLHPVAPTQSDNRTVDDILREAKEYKPMGKYNTRPSVRFEDDMERGGGGYTGSPSQSIDKTTEPSAALDLSPIAKSRSRDISLNYSGLDKPTANMTNDTQAFDATDPQESTPIFANRSHKKTPQSAYKDPFSHVKSSGYGKNSGPSSQQHSTLQDQQQQLWCPADIHRNHVKVGDVKPPLKTTPRSTNTTKPSSTTSAKQQQQNTALTRYAHHNASTTDQNSMLLESVQSIGDYIKKHMSVNNNNSFMSTGVPEVQWSQDGPVLSSSQKLAVLEREQHMLHEVKDWQQQLREERKIQAKLKVELDAKDRGYYRNVEQLKVQHEQELFKLRQENYVMAAKITEEGSNKRPVLAQGEPGDAAVAEQIKLMEREIQEQEQLLAGYQQENERVYQEMKKLQTVGKTTEEKMFKDNQRLQNEVVSLRDQLNRKEMELKNKGLITGIEVQREIAAGNLHPSGGGGGGAAVLGAGRIAHLEAGLKDATKREESLIQEISAYRHSKQELESQLDGMTRDMKMLEMRVSDARLMQDKHDQHQYLEYDKEIEKLNKKLRWYAENQAMLDNDARVIKEKDEEIKRVKAKLQELQSESGRKTAEARSKAKDRSADAKRIQDLERQVREMENVVRKRHPNSLPVLMWAASTTPDPVSTAPQSSSATYLENRVGTLERELMEKDEEGKRMLRGLEQKYNAVKYQYEERIEDLETRLGKYERPGDQNLKEGERPHSHTQAIQRELDSCRDRYKKETSDLKTEVDKLKKELSSLKNKETANNKAEQKSAKEKDTDLELRVKALQLEHSKQEKDRHLLQFQVEKLQKEKQQLLIEASRSGGRIAKASNEKMDPTRRGRNRPKSAGSVRSNRSRSSEPPGVRTYSLPQTDLEPFSLPPYTDDFSREKYEPDAFAGQHVSDLLRENQLLKHKCDELQLEASTTRVTVNKVYAEAESRERRLREDCDAQLHQLKLSHQGEVQRLLTEHAMDNSSSKLAETTAKLNTHQVVISHLKEQLGQAKVDGEHLATLKIRETTMEAQVKQLLDELQEAKRNHTPEMRHYEALQNKILQLESRHKLREQEVKQIIHQTQANATADLSAEIAKWKKVVDSKNAETELFRTELDSILGVLRELQRQGVLLPINVRR